MTLDNRVAAGEVLQGTDGTEIVVTSILENATDPENRLYRVAVAVSYVSGADSLYLKQSNYALIGDNRLVYNQIIGWSRNPCGGKPYSLEAELFPGGQIQGTVCFRVESDDSNFVLIHEPSSYNSEDERRFLELDPERLGSATDISVPQPAPDTSAMGSPPGTTIDNPVAAGGVLQGTNGTKTIVTGIVKDADAWELILAENQFNDPPAEGYRFYMVAVSVSYPSGTDSIHVNHADDYDLVGDNRAVYDDEFRDHCSGIIPGELSAELYPGGQAEGIVCFEVPADDSNFILIHQPGSRDENRRFLKLE